MNALIDPVNGKIMKSMDALCDPLYAFIDEFYALVDLLDGRINECID